MRPLIAANWKMHGDMSWVEKPSDFNAQFPASERSGLDILICPPAPFIAPLKTTADAASIYIGAQNCHAAEKGAHTGEVSAPMLKSVGARFVITGHSERRAGGETDLDVCAKSVAVLAAGLIPIICVGESLEERESGRAKAVVEAQIKSSVPGRVGSDHPEIVIAYEPVWAIGTGKTASTADIAEMHSHIRGLVGPDIRLLYGGSVKPTNAAAILSTLHVNGALIGGAGLDMGDLSAIARAAL